MTISINGTETIIEITGKNLGDVLTFLDERAERAGQVIMAINLNGKPIDGDTLPAIAGTTIEDIITLELRTTAVRFMRVDALHILLGLCDFALNSPPPQTADEPINFGADARDFAQRYSGLFSAEENSFIDSLVSTLSEIKLPPAQPARDTLTRIHSFFGERLSEAEDPLHAMTSTARLFTALRDELALVSVKLQTGKEAEAMHTVVLVVELINKTVRILPDYIGCIDSELSIEGKSVQDFYDDFNSVLRELMDAFEHKDSILIGDLAEYEILPRMDTFFTAVSQLHGAKC